MWNRLLIYLKFGNLFCGIEHSTIQGQDILFISLLKQRKSELDIQKQFQAKNVEELQTLLSKHQHFSLIVNNDKVITKQIQSTENDKFKLANKAFPNLDLKEFYLEVLSFEETHFISLCRKDVINELIEQYHKKNLYPTSFSLGVSSIKHLISFIKREEFNVSNYKIKIHENSIISLDNSADIIKEDYEVNSLLCSSDYLLSLASGLGSAINTNSALTINYENDNSRLFKLYINQQFYNRFLRFGLFAIFGILLVNFLFFNHYFNKTSTLQQTVSLNKTTKETVTRLQDEVTNKQKMVEDILKNSSSKSSYYINQLISLMPLTITIDKLEYQPLLKSIKPDKPIEIQEAVITLEGKLIDANALSKWITELENINETIQIQIKEYTEVKSLSSFKIEISEYDF